MKVFRLCLIFIIFIILVIFLGRLVSLKYVSEYQEGSFISDYYLEENTHDVIFLGDCEAYTSFSPMEIYKNSGITSYVRGSSQQLIGQSFYILKETLRYEKPKVVVLSVGGMRYNRQTREEYNRLAIDKMKWSMEKIEMIKYSMLENENFLSYVFPLLRYHDRITKLTSDDIKYLFKNDSVSHNGFIINTEVKQMTTLPQRKVLSDYNFSEENMDYLEKIYTLCKDNGIILILEKSPTMYPYWYSEYNQKIKDFADQHQIDYYNFLEKIDEIGLDFNYDTFDSGVHLNLSGATKFSKYFTRILQEKYHLEGHYNDSKINNDYNNKIRKYEEEVYEKNN